MKSFVDFLKLIKFAHTLFALPFALAAYILALADNGNMADNFKPLILVWILVAMVGMRWAWLWEAVCRTFCMLSE